MIRVLIFITLFPACISDKNFQKIQKESAPIPPCETQYEYIFVPQYPLDEYDLEKDDTE